MEVGKGRGNPRSHGADSNVTDPMSARRAGGNETTNHDAWCRGGAKDRVFIWKRNEFSHAGPEAHVPRFFPLPPRWACPCMRLLAVRKGEDPTSLSAWRLLLPDTRTPSTPVSTSGDDLPLSDAEPIALEGVGTTMPSYTHG